MKSSPGRNRFLIIGAAGLHYRRNYCYRDKETNVRLHIFFWVVMRGCFLRYLALRKRFEFLTGIMMTIIWLQLHVDGRRCSSSAISFNLRRCHEVAFQGSVLCEVITDNQVNFFIHIQQIGANNLSSCHGNGLHLDDFSALLRVCFLAYRTVVTDIFWFIVNWWLAQRFSSVAQGSFCFQITKMYLLKDKLAKGHWNKESGPMEYYSSLVGPIVTDF